MGISFPEQQTVRLLAWVLCKMAGTASVSEYLEVQMLVSLCIPGSRPSRHRFVCIFLHADPEPLKYLC